MLAGRFTTTGRRSLVGRPRHGGKCRVPRASQVIEGKRVAVVGGGPAGMMAAAHMAKLGADVDVYERYSGSSDGNINVPESSRSFRAGWLILLGSGAAQTFEAAGISCNLGDENRLSGGRFVSVTGPQFFGDWDKNSAASYVGLASRTTIADHIRKELARVYDSQVTVHDGYALTGGDPTAGRLVFEGADGEAVEVSADLVIGADGLNSAVRKLLQQQDTDLTAKTARCCTKTLPLFLSSLGGPAAWGDLKNPNGEPSAAAVPDGVTSVSGASMHVFFCAPEAKDETVAFWVSSGVAGAETAVALTVAQEWWDEPKSEAEVLEWLKGAYPHVPLVWLEEAAAECAKVIAGDRRNLRQHQFLELNKLGSGRAVLVGDAGHAMSPHLGMGCNSALADGAALAAALRAVDGDLDAVAAEFTATRLPEMLALVRMTHDRYTNVTFPIHRRLRALLPALPFGLAYEVADFPKLPGWLRPQTSTRALHEGASPLLVQRALNGWGRAALCTAAAVAVVLAAGLLKAASLVTA